MSSNTINSHSIYSVPPPSYNSIYFNSINEYSQKNINPVENNYKPEYQRQIHTKVIQKPIKKTKYHGPVDNSKGSFYKVTTKYTHHHNHIPTQVYYIENNTPIYNTNNYSRYMETPLHRSLRTRNIDDTVIFHRTHLSNENYFREQKRLLKNKHENENLKLESMSVYSHLQTI